MYTSLIMIKHRILFNSSVIKPLFDSNVKKLLMFNTAEYLSGNKCEHCAIDGTPKYTTVTFTGLVTCSDCYNCDAPDVFSTKGDNIAENINGRKFHLLNKGAGSYCTWSLPVLSGTYGTLKRWNAYDCPGSPDVICGNQMYIPFVTRAATQIAVTAYVYDSEGYCHKFFDFTGIPTSLSDCINAICSNSLITCGYDLGAVGGICTIQEGWK